MLIDRRMERSTPTLRSAAIRQPAAQLWQMEAILCAIRLT